MGLVSKAVLTDAWPQMGLVLAIQIVLSSRNLMLETLNPIPACKLNVNLKLGDAKKAKQETNANCLVQQIPTMMILTTDENA